MLRVGALLALLLAAALSPAAEQITWPEPLYNPAPRADDVLLPLPCGGAMAFRAVATPGRDAGYAVTGPFEREDGTPYLLVGKYEVTAIQTQALAAQAAGRPCPKPQAALQAPQVGDWWDALEIADRYSLWLASNAEALPSCADGASPCLPRVDGVPAYLRLPTDTEWEYAARGGLSVTAEQFAASRYPMSEGLPAHAWYAPNAGGALQPIGGRSASPLGLHDLYGNAAEWALGSSGPVALVLGGHAGSPEVELGVDRRWALPPFAADPAAHTGLRLLASVPLFTSPEKVREAERRRLAQPVPAVQVPQPPSEPQSPPVKPLASLRVTTNVPAEVLIDGQVIGQAKPGEPFESQAIDVGERVVAVRAEGHEPAAQIQRFLPREWIEANFSLIAVKPPKPAVAEPAPVATPSPKSLGPRLPFEPEMIALPGGEFWMGSPGSEGGRSSDEGPRHQVRIAPFAIGKTEVTFAQYDAFAEATGRAKPEDMGWGRGDRPVINVSWEDAVAYAAWLPKETGEKYRLPSEAEWEYAARAGTEDAYWWGQGSAQGNANCGGCGGKWDGRQTAPVGSFKANPWGLYDTAGNVWEWVQDPYHYSYEGAPADGSVWEAGGSSARVVRGGCWLNSPRDLRAAIRGRNGPVLRNDYLGFRLARTLPP